MHGMNIYVKLKATEMMLTLYSSVEEETWSHARDSLAAFVFQNPIVIVQSSRSADR